MDDAFRVLHVDDDPAVVDVAAEFLERADDQYVLDTGESLRNGEIVPHGGDPHRNLTIKSPVFTDEGDLTGTCAVSTDVTDWVSDESE